MEEASDTGKKIRVGEQDYLFPYPNPLLTLGDFGSSLNPIGIPLYSSIYTKHIDSFINHATPRSCLHTIMEFCFPDSQSCWAISPRFSYNYFSESSSELHCVGLHGAPTRGKRKRVDYPSRDLVRPWKLFCCGRYRLLDSLSLDPFLAGGSLLGKRRLDALVHDSSHPLSKISCFDGCFSGNLNSLVAVAALV